MTPPLTTRAFITTLAIVVIAVVLTQVLLQALNVT